MLNPTLFSTLPVAMQQLLRAAGVVRRFTAGQMIQHRGDEGSGVWLIERGQVRIGQFDREGNFDALALLGEGDSYGELAVFARQPRVVDALAVGEVALLWIPAGAIELALGSDPAALRGLLAGMAAQFQEALNLLALLRRSRGGDRIAQLLAALAGASSAPRRIVITQQELADMVGTSRMTVSTALERIEREGLIRRGYGWIEVHDPEGLLAMLGD